MSENPCGDCGGKGWVATMHQTRLHCDACDGSGIAPTPARSEAAGGEEDERAGWRHVMDMLRRLATEIETQSLRMANEAVAQRHRHDALVVAKDAEIARFRASEGALQDVIGEGRNIVADLRQQLAAAREELREAEAHIGSLGGPLLHHFGTTDPQLLAEVLQDRAEQADAAREDAVRLDWLSRKVVNVRGPLRYGSRDMFWSSPGEDEGEEMSDLRARIDAARASAATPTQPQRGEGEDVQC